MISHNELLKTLSYDPTTGEFKWIRNDARLGRIAGSINSIGYRYITINGKSYNASHLAWFYSNYIWSDNFIDHINGNKSDNSIKNLRPATYAENNMNARIRRDNTSGSKGVCWKNREQLWVAQITVNKKAIMLGYFKDKKLAIFAYAEASRKYHGSFGNTG